MPVFFLIMYLLAVVCFLVAAFNVTIPRANLMALGLAFFAVPNLVLAIQQVGAGG